jgi:hypothetical protein
MHITTTSELADVIREAFVDCDRMEPDLDTIADRLVRKHTFGGQLNFRRGRPTAAGVRMAVAMFFEHEYEETGAIDDPKRDEALERAQEFLDAVGDLRDVRFTVETLAALQPLDRQRFYRLLLDVADPEELQAVYAVALRNIGETEKGTEEANEEDKEAAQ